MSDSAVRELIDSQDREKWRAALLELKTRATSNRVINAPYGYLTPSVVWITLLVLLYGGTTLLNQTGGPGQALYSTVAMPIIVLGVIVSLTSALLTGLSVPREKLKTNALGTSFALFGLAYTYTYILNPSDANQLLEFLIRTVGLSDTVAVLIFLLSILLFAGAGLGVLALTGSTVVLAIRLVLNSQSNQHPTNTVE